ncbi:MAG: hypothetical protein ACO1OO_12065 [Flavisolibacter sp.]
MKKWIILSICMVCQMAPEHSASPAAAKAEVVVCKAKSKSPAKRQSAIFFPSVIIAL